MQKCKFNSATLLLPLFCYSFNASASADKPLAMNNYNHWQPVSGQAIHYFPTAIMHSVVETDGSKTEQRSDTIELSGDIVGRIIYHVTSKTNYAAASQVNTGYQVLSGSILGGEPVMLLDEDFSFTVNLNTGDVLGSVFFSQTLAGAPIQCRLTVTGTGLDAQGNGLADYTGYCGRDEKP